MRQVSELGSLGGNTMSAQSPEVQAFLADLSPEQRRLVAALRLLIRQTAPETDETILWHSLSYHRPNLGGRIKGAVCLITPRSGCVHLGFIHGSALSDPLRLLHGAGKAKRFVALRRITDIDQRALGDLVKAAAEYDPRNTA